MTKKFIPIMRNGLKYKLETKEIRNVFILHKDKRQIPSIPNFDKNMSPSCEPVNIDEYFYMRPNDCPTEAD